MRATLRGVVVTGAATAALLATACARLGSPPRAVERRIPGPSGLLFVEDAGSGGIPVLLVHSYAGSCAHWASQLRHLSRSRRTLAMDLRGHGRSASPADDDYAIASLAADIDAVAGALGLGRFVLVGHSLGGAAAIEYAGTHPERVAGLALVGAPGKLAPQQARQILQSLEADYLGVMRGYWDKLVTGARPVVRARLLREMNSVPHEASLALIRAVLDYDPLPALARYSGPKFVVFTPHGDTPNDLQNLIPGIPQSRIERASHWPHLDRPRELNALLDRFLATVG